MINQLPTFKTKVFFWIIFGAISTFFAEVVSGSFHFPFLINIDAWGVLFLIPFYTFHVLIMAYFVYNYGKPLFHTLFIAGAIIGMYEAYATGILWTGWNEGPMITIFKLGVIETIILVLFWHPIMAFFVPVIVVETLLTKTRESITDIKRFTTKKYLIALAVLFAFFQAFNTTTILKSLLAGIANIPVLALMIYLWRKYYLDRYRMVDLLPSKKQVSIIFILLMLQYAFLASMLSYKTLSLTSHAFIWFLYCMLFCVFHKSLKKSKIDSQNVLIKEVVFSWTTFTLLSIIFVFFSMLFTVITNQIREIAWGIILLIYLSSGVFFLSYVLKKIYAKNR
ncbi:MAG: hypothetical protein ACLKAK_08570 [Alkaliphilus sp.]